MGYLESKNMRKIIAFVFIASFFLACEKKVKQGGNLSVTVSIETADADLAKIIDNEITVTVLGTGFDWTEGPLWLESEKKLLFSDVPRNTIYQWAESADVSEYIKPSGYTSETPRGGEPGSNGLALDDEGNLLLCQHGDRRVAMMNTSLTEPSPDFTTIADKYEGKRFNSPNDLVFLNHNIFFTDPAYGLPKQMDDPAKEIPFQGVYRISAKGNVKLLIDSLTRPNGIGFSPDGKKMYVANSDEKKARWYEYQMSDSMKITSGKILYDATAFTTTEKGLPDGLKVAANGNIFATGPGGVWIFNGVGKLLGKIKLQEATSNCALTADGKTLFVTNDMNILRIQLRK